MPPCHATPFIKAGIVISDSTKTDPPNTAVAEVCDYCGADTLEWRKCKLICASCRQINKSCADL